ncbi:C40 family peptidase [Latilactobacillus fragifolii]|uniref:C40 family peptidase n=1 Tax=Latilactobacillus fragifolii TaxID=2814244 RepID=UPI001ABA3FC6|nr:NlpC/P60 family protein [Latilactobacillus fragifolii]
MDRETEATLKTIKWIKRIITGLVGSTLLTSFFMAIAIVILSFFLLLQSAENDNQDCGYSGATKGISSKVLRFQNPIAEEMQKDGVPSTWLGVLLAHVQQESGGNAEQYPDIFQASESMGLPPNTLGTQASIEQGVKFFKSQLAAVKDITGHEPSPTNEGDVNITSVLYNAPAFGPWLKKTHGGQWSVAANDEFYEQVLPTYGAGPGDKNYYKHILQYYDVKGGTASTGANTNEDCGASGSGDQSGNAIIAEAQKYLGIPYVWGGKNPEQGMDCSGFVGYVLTKVTGKQYPQYTVALETKGDMMFAGGKPDMSQLQPGDMLFWGAHGASHHIAFYMGNGKVIEEPQPGDVCHIRVYKDGSEPDFAVRPKL